MIRGDRTILLAMPTLSEPRVLLHGIRWDTYERLLEDLVASPAIRLTYDRGALEVMTVSHRHERWKTLAGRMIEAMTEELGVPIHSGGSTTFRRRDLELGLEPDECYWVQNEARVRGKLDLELPRDPAPDLVLEAEVSRSALDRRSILAALGVGEVWRYDGERLTVHVLAAAGDYREGRTSRSFPWLPIEAFERHLRCAGDTDETSWIRAFRLWVRDNVRTDG
jgi:Uma2 family endonuclease